MFNADRFSLLLEEWLPTTDSVTDMTRQDDDTWRLLSAESLPLHVACDVEREMITFSATIGSVLPDNRQATFEAMLLLNSASGAGGVRHGLNAPLGEIQLELDLPATQATPDSLSAVVDALITRAALWLGIVARGGLDADASDIEELAPATSDFLRV